MSDYMCKEEYKKKVAQLEKGTPSSWIEMFHGQGDEATVETSEQGRVHGQARVPRLDLGELRVREKTADNATDAVREKTDNATDATTPQRVCEPAVARAR